MSARFKIDTGDNIIIVDQQSELLLYGHQLCELALKAKNPPLATVLHIEGEAYSALLELYFSHVPEVQRYRSECERTGLINPDGEGKLLSDVSDAIELRQEHLEIMMDGVERAKDSGRWQE